MAVRIGFALSLLLLIASAAAFYYASRVAQKGRHDVASATTVTITGQSCKPNELTVAAGPHTFQITNRSDRVVEWEILDGVMVVEERENIAPGFTQTLATRLDPGDYAITCDLLSNPRGRLHVLPAASAGVAKKPELLAFIGALAEYKVFLTNQADGFVRAADALADAVKSGDVAAAKALYGPALAAYAPMAPVSPLFSDLDAAIDARADYFEKREADPGFGGLHRIEDGLFSQGGTASLGPVADKLSSDAATLKARIHDLRIMPDSMIGGAASALERFATAGTEESSYAHDDLASFEASLAGVRKVFDLLRPIVVKTQADPVAAIDKDFSLLDGAIASSRAQTGVSGTLNEAARGELGKVAATLAADLSRLRDGMELD
jgi:iron uptake system component EfeO